MPSSQNFSFSETSAILGQEVHGFDILVSGLKQGHSIAVHQSGHKLISVTPTDEQFLFCQTAGTSGAAKTIRRRPASWIRSFEINRSTFGIGPDDTYTTCGQLGHSLSLYATLEAVHIGADILPLAGVSPKKQIRELISNQASILYVTPAQLHLLSAGASALGIDEIRCVRHIFSGGGKLNDAQRMSMTRLFPTALIHEFFGASETSFISMTDAETPEGSVGLPYPDVSLEIRTESPSEPAQTGEIWVKSPYLFECYDGIGSPDTRWDGSFLSIGEMGYLDANGYLFLRGRKNRMVTVADVNVFPEEIEKTLMSLTQVQRCVALGQPDETRGYRMVCVIEGRADPDLEKRMRLKCREELGAHAVPYRFHFTDDIPLLVAGKPDLQTLKRRLDIPN